MYFYKTLVLFLLFGGGGAYYCNAQEDKIDTVYTEKKVKFLFGLDATQSFVLKNKSKFWGLRIGIEIKNKHKLGVGFYGMDTPVYLAKKLDDTKYPNANDTLIFNFNYNTLFYEYVWYQSKRWELSTPFHLGTGEVTVKYKDMLTGGTPIFFNGKTGLVVTSFSAQFLINRWLALGSGVGYRYLLSKNEKVKTGLNAPIYVFRVKILFGELFKKWFVKGYYNPYWD